MLICSDKNSVDFHVSLMIDPDEIPLCAEGEAACAVLVEDFIGIGGI